MAKKDKPEPGATPIKRSDVEGLVERYFGHAAKAEKIMAEARKKAEAPRADMGVVIDDAERKGINRRAFKGLVSRLKKLRQAEADRDKLEADVQDALDHLEDMLDNPVPSFDDTPLGKLISGGGLGGGTKATKPAAKAKANGNGSAEAGKPKEAGSDPKVVALAKASGASLPSEAK